MSDKTEIIFLLIVLFQLKHFICDYILQGRYMLGKFKDGWDWILPLTCHCLVHALGTFIILQVYLESKFVWFYVIADFILHFIMDRIKASPNLLGRFSFQDRRYWLSLGLDQMFHHLTHYWIIYGVII